MCREYTMLTQTDRTGAEIQLTLDLIEQMLERR